MVSEDDDKYYQSEIIRDDDDDDDCDVIFGSFGHLSESLMDSNKILYHRSNAN